MQSDKIDHKDLNHIDFDQKENLNTHDLGMQCIKQGIECFKKYGNKY